MTPARTVVISDLHISADKLDDFDSELEGHLVAFLQEELSKRPYSVQLVINGDFLDFVQAPPYNNKYLQAQSKDKVPLCFTEDQSREKLKAIYKSHGAVFRSLKDFLSSNSAHSVVILPGNHDADFYWPLVRSDFMAFVASNKPSISQQISIHLDRSYHPPQCPSVWIEHGQQYDPVNSFEIGGYPYWSEKNPPILSDGFQERLYACLGTRFLIDYINDLDADYPFVDNVKPFSRFVRLFLLSAVKFGFGPLKAAVAGCRILAYLSGLAVKHPKDLLGIEQAEEDARQTVLRRLKDAASRNTKEFQRINQEYPDDRDLRLLLDNSAEQMKVIDWLAEHLDLLEEGPAASSDMLSIDGEDDSSYLSLAKSFRLNETALLVDAAEKILDPKNTGNSEVVVMGHTHEPVIKPEGLNYFNIGSWTRYYRFDADAKASAWSILKDQSYINFPYQLNYVEIDSSNPSAARMVCYQSRNHD